MAYATVIDNNSLVVCLFHRQLVYRVLRQFPDQPARVCRFSAGAGRVGEEAAAVVRDALRPSRHTVSPVPQL